jgi:hypothetical protein
MKNTDKTIPYMPSPAELERFRIRPEKMVSSNFSLDEENEKMAENLNTVNKLTMFAVLAVLVVVIIVMISLWNSPASFTTISWNG